ncbi:MAG TPA: dual specificity protein phosphatase [Ktedonobacterales bacterium]|nr:dual specificity protein phosphatase [Ktedonobacterales bacterium]
MASRTKHIRYFGSPYTTELFDSYIERIVEVLGPGRSGEIQVDVRLARPLGASQIERRDGHEWEVLRVERAPYRLRFSGGRWHGRTGCFSDFAALPADHGARRLFEIVHLRFPSEQPCYLLLTDLDEVGHEASIRATECRLEPRPGPVTVEEVRRRWTWRPPNPPVAVVARPTLHRRFGGDPIAIHLGQRLYRHRLFIGGLRHQSDERPQVDHVLNLCERENPWCATHGAHPQDRFSTKGEMVQGMLAAELRAEAEWAVERLRAGRRVLIHCWGGINRSSSVCCAALLLLEGITPEEALARVRAHHVEAAPDPYHWFALQRLAADLRQAPPRDAARQPPLPEALREALREAAAIR